MSKLPTEQMLGGLHVWKLTSTINNAENPKAFLHIRLAEQLNCRERCHLINLASNLDKYHLVSCVAELAFGSRCRERGSSGRMLVYRGAETNKNHG